MCLLCWWISTDVPTQTHQLEKKYQRYQNIIHSSILVTKESSNKQNDQNIIYKKGTNFALNMKNKSYNLLLNVAMLLHMPIPCTQKLQLTPPMLTLLIWLEPQCNNITFLSLNHGVSARFYRPLEDRDGWENSGWSGREILLGGISSPGGPRE